MTTHHTPRPEPAPRWTTVPSPIGHLLLVGSDTALRGLYVADHERSPSPDPRWTRDDGAFDGVVGQLDEYFAGARTAFDVPLDLAGTPFQVRVWHALLEIPFGETASYGDVARRIGSPAAVRAVGAANGRNPVSIVVPCHRVIGADGGLAGYGWGPERKAWLLAHERSAVGTALAGI